MTNQAKESVGITMDEVQILFAACVERGDLKRADMWASILLEANDPESPDA